MTQEKENQRNKGMMSEEEFIKLIHEYIEKINLDGDEATVMKVYEKYYRKLTPVGMVYLEFALIVKRMTGSNEPFYIEKARTMFEIFRHGIEVGRLKMSHQIEKRMIKLNFSDKDTTESIEKKFDNIKKLGNILHKAHVGIVEKKPDITSEELDGVMDEFFNKIRSKMNI